MLQAVYEPIASGPDDEDHEHNFSYIKCIDHGKQVIEGVLLLCSNGLRQK